MWQILEQRALMHYGKLEEFVSVVMEVFPDLMEESQRMELTQGLQNGDCKMDPTIETHFWEFLSRLDQQLLLPDFSETAILLGAAPSVMEDCLKSLYNSDQLRTALKHRRCFGQVDRVVITPGKKRKLAVAEVLDELAEDSGANVFLVDSSSEDEDLLLPVADNSDSDYETPSSECDDEDYEPPSTEPSPWKQPSICTPSPEGGRSIGRVSGSLPRPRSRSSDADSVERQPQRKRKPVAARRSLGAFLSGEGIRWHNREEKDEKPDPLKFTPARTPGPTFNTAVSWSPLALFQLFFSSSVVRTLIDNTNANAAKMLLAGKKFAWKALTVKDFYIFMAIIIYSGLVKVHHMSDYWRRIFPYGFHFPRESMTRDRFEAILWSLHLSNPKEDEENEHKRNTAEYDRLFKIKPLYTDMVTACQAHFHPRQNISIDERMVASKARIGLKQYMKNKPTKRGYKLFVLADAAIGYTWNFFVYTGKSVSGTGQRLSYSSVMDLLPFSLLGKGYSLYVDNFYTSPALFRDLSQKSIGCCGTIRKNGAGFPQNEENDLPKKAERGDIRWMRRDGLLFVKWMDTREVTMCSTVHKAFSGQTVKRKVKEGAEWTIKSVPVPDTVVDYNQNMGGVDLSDALIDNYSVCHKTLKWYKTFFYHFIDIAVVNSYLLHKELFKIRSEPNMDKPHTHKSFREQLAAEMLAYAEHSAAATLPQSTCTSACQRSTAATFPQSTCMPDYYREDASSSRKNCKRCRSAGFPRVKTPVHCRNCQVPLCLTSRKNCFRQWHDEQELLEK